MIQKKHQKYVNTKYKYLFFKSKKIKRKLISLHLLPNMISILKISVLYNIHPSIPNCFPPYANVQFQNLRLQQTENQSETSLADTS